MLLLSSYACEGIVLPKPLYNKTKLEAKSFLCFGRARNTFNILWTAFSRAMFAKIPLLLAALGLLLGSGNAFDNHFRPAAIGGRHAIQLKATPRFVGAANTSESFALLEARRSLSLFSRQEQECDPGYCMSSKLTTPCTSTLYRRRLILPPSYVH